MLRAGYPRPGRYHAPPHICSASGRSQDARVRRLVALYVLPRASFFGQFCGMLLRQSFTLSPTWEFSTPGIVPNEMPTPPFSYRTAVPLPGVPCSRVFISEIVVTTHAPTLVGGGLAAAPPHRPSTAAAATPVPTNERNALDISIIAFPFQRSVDQSSSQNPSCQRRARAEGKLF